MGRLLVRIILRFYQLHYELVQCIVLYDPTKQYTEQLIILSGLSQPSWWRSYRPVRGFDVLPASVMMTLVVRTLDLAVFPPSDLMAVVVPGMDFDVMPATVLMAVVVQVLGLVLAIACSRN